MNQKLIDKIAKIKAMAESARKIGSDVEAEAFAAKFHAMLIDHKLSMTDIELADNQHERVRLQMIDYPDEPEFKEHHKRNAWRELLALTIAEFHFCSVVFYNGTDRLALVGKPSDIEVCEYLILQIFRAVTQLADRETKAYYARTEKPGEPTTVHADGLMTVIEKFYAAMRIKNNPAIRKPGFRKAFIRAFTMRLYQRFKAQQTAAGEGLMRLSCISVQENTEYLKNSEIRIEDPKLELEKDMHEEGTRRGVTLADDISLQANGLKGAEPQTRKEIA